MLQADHGVKTIVLRRCIVGKYVLAWLLGVPVFVLVIVYLLFH